MFTRVKTTPNSPRRSVQVVESLRVGAEVSQKIVRYMGIAMDDAEEAKLRQMAQEFIERETLARYRRLWVIEESFRTIKHSLSVRPIYHFKPERIQAHIGICYLASRVQQLMT